MEFTETQQFRQWWLWLILIIVLIISFIGITYSMSSANGVFKDKTVYYFTLTLLPVLVMGLMWLLALETYINDKGIRYRFFPLQLKLRAILWDEVETANIRIYKPLTEYGGWGLRYTYKNGKAVNVSGNEGLQLVLKNGKKLLIGTNKKEELAKMLNGLYVKGIVKDKNDIAKIKDRF